MYHSYRLIYPSSFLNLGEDKKNMEMYLLINSLEDELLSVVVSLNLYQGTLGKFGNDSNIMERCAEIKEEVRSELSLKYGTEAMFTHREEFDEIVRARVMKHNIVPRNFIHKEPFLHAHSTLFHTEMFGKTLKIIMDDDDTPDEIRNSWHRYQKSFPGISDLRDSAAHKEDRIRGKSGKRKKKKIVPKGGYLSVGNLMGDELEYTNHHGELNKLSISKTTVRTLNSIAQDVINSFSWRVGPFPTITPHI